MGFLPEPKRIKRSDEGRSGGRRSRKVRKRVQVVVTVGWQQESGSKNHKQAQERKIN